MVRRGQGWGCLRVRTCLQPRSWHHPAACVPAAHRRGGDVGCSSERVGPGTAPPPPSAHCGAATGHPLPRSDGPFLPQIDFHGSYSEAHSAGDFGTVWSLRVCQTPWCGARAPRAMRSCCARMRFRPCPPAARAPGPRCAAHLGCGRPVRSCRSETLCVSGICKKKKKKSCFTGLHHNFRDTSTSDEFVRQCPLSLTLANAIFFL